MYSEGNSADNIWYYIIDGTICFNCFDEALFLRKLFGVSNQSYIPISDVDVFSNLLSDNTILTIHIPDHVFTIISVDTNEIYLIDYYVEAHRTHNIYIVKIEHSYLLKLITAILTNDVDTYMEILDVDSNMKNDILESWNQNDNLKRQYPNDILWNRINVEVYHINCYPNINTLETLIINLKS